MGGVGGGGAWVAVWFEEVGGGGCSHGFQEEPKGISHCQQSMKGRLLEIDRQLTSNKGGGGGKGVHKNITEPYGEGNQEHFVTTQSKTSNPHPSPHPKH